MDRRRESVVYTCGRTTAGLRRAVVDDCGGENGKANVVKKRKRKRIHGRLGLKLAQLPFPGNGARKLVGYFKRKQKKSVSARIPM